MLPRSLGAGEPDPGDIARVVCDEEPRGARRAEEEHSESQGRQVSEFEPARPEQYTAQMLRQSILGSPKEHVAEKLCIDDRRDGVATNLDRAGRGRRTVSSDVNGRDRRG